jgi:hypothetical protein
MAFFDPSAPFAVSMCVSVYTYYIVGYHGAYVILEILICHSWSGHC